MKAEHQHPTCLLQPLSILEWKWEVLSLDFIIGFPLTQKQHDSIMVVVYKLSKVTHFIPMKSAYKDGQKDGQKERNNQVIEDMLRMYVIEKPTKWEDYLHLVEFPYKNGYQERAKMRPFEILYRSKCATPSSWDSPMDHFLVGPKMLCRRNKLIKST